MMKTYYSEALRLPYSIGAHRLLREIVSDLADIPLPPEPEVRHGPVQAPRVPPMWRKALPPAERRALVLDALRRGPVTQAEVPQIDSWQLSTAVQQLRRAGHVIQNTRPRSAGARYVLHRQTEEK